MPSQLLIGLIAGFTAALMLFSAARGASITGFLLSLTSMLPIFLAGLGWQLRAAIIAALTGAGLFSLIGTPLAGSIWLVTQGVPALLLCHFAFLSRPVAISTTSTQSASPPQPVPTPVSSQQQGVEWYPVGYLVAMVGGIGGLLASLLLTMMGTSVEAIHGAIRKVVDQIIKNFPALAPEKLSAPDLDKVVDILVYAWPVSFGIICVAILLLNFWLAARITRASGRFIRPWPDLAAIRLPRLTALALFAALLGTYLGGMAGLYASAFAGALMFIYMLVGLAIIHYVTRGNPYRGFILWALYVALFLFNTYVMLALAILAITEPINPFRRRLAVTGNPPDHNSQRHRD